MNDQGSGMTKEEFELEYARKSGMLVTQLDCLGLHAEPCDCRDESCHGWQMVSQ